MQHVNPEIRKAGISGFLLDMTLPEIYFATSIADFLDEKKNVKPTSYLRSFGFTLPLRPGGNNLIGRAMINFFDVTYMTHDDNPAIIDLEDEINRMTVGLHAPNDHYKSAEEQGLRSGDRIQLASVLYDPRRDSVQLIAARKQLNIPTSDLSRANIQELMPAFGF